MQRQISYSYTVEFSNSLSLKKNKIINKIQDVLTNKKGWSKLGYNFNFMDVNTNPHFCIKIVPESTIVRICKFKGLSCADSNTNTIYININLWRKGSSKSKLNLEDYRTYLINHEVGHILGKQHIDKNTLKPRTKAPVMIQQTLGINDCIPNCWPLNWE
jgi:hypothetical protein